MKKMYLVNSEKNNGVVLTSYEEVENQELDVIASSYDVKDIAISAVANEINSINWGDLSLDSDPTKVLEVGPDIRAARLTEFISPEHIIIQAANITTGHIEFREEKYSVDEYVRRGYALVAPGVYYASVKGNKTRQRNSKKFSRELLLLDFSNALVNKGRDDAYNRIEDVLRDHRIFVVYPSNENEKPGIYVRLRNGDKNIFVPLEKKDNLLDRSCLKREEMDLLIKQGRVQMYWTWWNAPSAIRTLKCSFVRAHSYDWKTEVPRLEEITDKVTCGTYFAMKEEYGDEETAFSELYKKISRNCLSFTDSSRYGVIKSIAIVRLPKELEDDFLYKDGQGIISSEVLRREYSLRHKCPTEIRDFVGLVLQARSGAIKGFHTTESPNSIAQKLLWIIEKYGKECVELHGVPDYSIESLKKIDFVGDHTTVKADFNFDAENPFCVMGLPKGLNGSTHVSLQIAGPLMAIPGSLEFFKKRTDTAIDRLFEDTEKEITKISQVKDILYPMNTIEILDRKSIFLDDNLFNNFIKQIIENGLKNINRFHLPVKGSYCLLVRDFGLDFGKALLADDEVYIPGKKIDKKTMNFLVDIYRHPKNAPREHFMCKAVSREELLARVARSEHYTHEQKLALVENILFLMEGTIMVPSGNKKFAALLGGCDYDGDGVIVIWDREFIALSKKIPCLAIDFGKAPKSDEKARFNFFLRDLCYLKQIQNGNEPTGVTTNRNQALISLLSHVINCDDNELNKLFCFLRNRKDKSLKNILHYSSPYVKMFDKDNVLIDEEAVIKFIKEVERCGIESRENLINILDDIFAVNASCVGRIIDSAKNGAKVTVPFAKLGDYIKSGMIKEYKFGTTINSDKVKFFDENMFPIIKNIEFGYTGNTFIIKDSISCVKEYAVKQLLFNVVKYTVVYKLFNKQQ